MPDRVAFQLGPIVVHWYGIMIMLGVILASYIAYTEAKRRNEDPDHVWQLFPWVLIAGILGARLGWVLPNIGSIPQEPLPAFGMELPWPFRYIAIWLGGLSIQGAVIGGAIPVIIYTRMNRLSFLKWGDIIVPGVALAQAIGRWGNYFNQEAFGEPTTLPWGLQISSERQLAVAGREFEPGTRFHPTFAYEMVWDLLNFAVLMWLGRQRKLQLRQGDILWLYVIIYSIGRFAIEGLRIDSTTVEGLKVPQLVAILSVILGWTMIVWNHRPGTNVPLSEENLPEGYVRPRRSGEAGAEYTRRVRRVAVAPSGGSVEEGAASSSISPVERRAGESQAR